MGVNFSLSRASAPNCCPEDFGANMEQESEEEFLEAQEELRSPSQDLVQFKKELALKREERRQIIAKHTSEKENLRKSLQTQIQANEYMVKENKLLRAILEENQIVIPETVVSENVNSDGPITVLMEDLENLKEQNRKLQRNLADTNVSLQSANSDMATLQGQHVEYMKQISALKEVVAVSKTMMQIRESQLNELKAKLAQIEQSLADREANLLSTDLRAEYERQLQNIRTLRSLYEERARLAEATRLQLLRELEEQKLLAAEETNRCKELTDKVAEMEVKITEMSDTIDNKDDTISVTKEETRGLKAEMTTVNKLFSQMLLGYKSHQDLDKLVSRLEENHGLLAHMVVKDGAEASSALPKLLLDLVGQLDPDKGEDKQTERETSLNTTAEEIVGNLPKVWKVVMELLSHQAAPARAALRPPTCYKPVETAAGTRMVPSVSQTYIRLKDLIVEKLSLTKEMTKMKQLNAHLECRLEEQEKRLCLVTSELSKTWHVVGRLRRHHHQLHTHEKILRYELQQKRKMLNELKEELEYCKEKWDKAKEKNTESEKELKKLRTEFSSRRSKINVSLNNSGESGYSDERQTEDDSTESNDESEYVNEPRMRCKRRLKKSFDILPDSSTDRNLVAEREDPISDSLDVAELPLDSLDADDKEDDLSTSDCSVSENFVKGYVSEGALNLKQVSFVNKIEGTTEDNSTASILQMFSTAANPADYDHSDANVASASKTPNHIFENIKKPNDMLTKKDDRLSALGENSVVVVTSNIETSVSAAKTESNEDQEHTKNGDNVNICDDSSHIEGKNEESGNMNPKGMEKMNNSTVEQESNENQNVNDMDGDIINIFDKNSHKTHEEISEQCGNKTDNCNVIAASNGQCTTNDNIAGPSKSIYPKDILENIRLQNERLAKRDERMRKLEEGCSSLLQTSRNTLQNGSNIEARLDIIHGQRNLCENKIGDTVTFKSKENSENEVVVETDNDESIVGATQKFAGQNQTESTTSTETTDHEARFAARDERLKRLEEQAKSLVDKVNVTTTKSVKITYKLEELHNIYGSEGGTSRNQNSDEETVDTDDHPPEDSSGES